MTRLQARWRLCALKSTSAACSGAFRPARPTACGASAACQRLADNVPYAWSFTCSGMPWVSAGLLLRKLRRMHACCRVLRETHQSLICARCTIRDPVDPCCPSPWQCILELVHILLCLFTAVLLQAGAWSRTRGTTTRRTRWWRSWGAGCCSTTRPSGWSAAGRTLPPACAPAATSPACCSTSGRTSRDEAATRHGSSKGRQPTACMSAGTKSVCCTVSGRCAAGNVA